MLDNNHFKLTYTYVLYNIIFNISLVKSNRILRILVIHHSAMTNYGMWLLNFMIIWAGFLKRWAITWIRREQKYFDFTEPWNPLFNKLLSSEEVNSSLSTKFFYKQQWNFKKKALGASIWPVNEIVVRLQDLVFNHVASWNILQTWNWTPTYCQ